MVLHPVKHTQKSRTQQRTLYSNITSNRCGIQQVSDNMSEIVSAVAVGGSK